MRLAGSGSRFEMPFHVVKRLDTPRQTYWLIKIAGFFVALLLAGLICTMLTPGSFLRFYQQMFIGCFDFTDIEVLMSLLETIGLLLLVAFALAPAFKMKFWNIGGEGQILVGCLATAAISKFMNASDIVIILVSLVTAVVSGIIWAVIPAIFKAFFNTNETLFTLMMNYVAMALIALCINIWVPSGSQVFGLLTNGGLPDLGLKYLLNIIIVAIVVALMIVYLKKTKHGYELSVVGESVNTARYVGINVKKVIIRTMILSGALCGLVGFLLVAGHHHTLSTGLAGGRGFTGVLIAWLGGFNPGQMILYAVLVGIFQNGSTYAASSMGMSSSDFSNIITGMFFLVVIASEFFVNYEIKRRHGVNGEQGAKVLTVPSYEGQVSNASALKEEASETIEEVKPVEEATPVVEEIKEEPQKETKVETPKEEIKKPVKKEIKEIKKPVKVTKKASKPAPKKEEKKPLKKVASKKPISKTKKNNKEAK